MSVQDVPAAEGAEEAEPAKPIRIAALQRQIPVRFPRSSDPLESLLAEANESLRQRALEQVSHDFPGIDWDVLANSTDGYTLHVGQVAEGVVERLHVRDLFDRVGSYHDPMERRLVMGPTGDGLAQQLGPDFIVPSYHSLIQNRLRHGPVADRFRPGGTLILNQVEQLSSEVMQVTEALATVFGSMANVNAYVSHGDAPGFGDHWDDHDVLIVQVSGRKRWEIFAPTALSPLRPNISNDISDEQVWTGVMEPGSMILIPRGWGHRVEGFPELSIHLTIGLNRFQSLTIIEQLAQEASNWPIFRADIPYDLSSKPESYAGSVFDHESAFLEHLTRMLPDGIERGVARYRAATRGSGISSFMSTLDVVVGNRWDEGLFEAKYPLGLMCADTDDPDKRTVAAGGQLWTMGADHLRVLATCASGRPVTVADVAARTTGLGGDVPVTSLLDDLVASGLVAVVGLTGEP